MDITKKILKNNSKIELKEIDGIVISGIINDTMNSSNIATVLNWEKTKDAGTHFVIDEKEIIQYIDEKYICNHCKTVNKCSYINNILFKGKTNEHTLGITICYPKDQKYNNIEQNAIKFIAKLLKKYNLTTDYLWREYDLNYLPSPIQYLQLDKWKKFLEIIKNLMKDMEDENFNEDAYNIDLIYKTDAEFRKQQEYNSNNIQKILDKLKPYDKNIPKLKESKEKAKGLSKKIDTQHDNTINYEVSEQSPESNSEDSCITPTIEADLKAIPKNCKVEPIYPDTIVPPGNSSTAFNSKDDTVSQKETSVSSIKEYEKRQKIFDPNKHKDAKKEDRGKPVNNNDPYPVDVKIKELEEHKPKLKIDDIIFDLENCNHPGCGLGTKLISNLCMLSDATIEQSKRTEKRLVKIENILSTLLRYHFRLSSRMNINCVYYGGQDVFNKKYKCIRCLHSDRINDGQSMTIDQCLNCSRYEPIIGQVYDILDEDGINLAAILDDNQMNYSNMEDYINFNRIEKMHTEKDNAEFKQTIETNETVKSKLKDIEKTNTEKYKKEKEKIEKEAIKKQKEETKNKTKDILKPINKETIKNDGDIASITPKLTVEEQLIIIDEQEEQRKIDKNIPKLFKNVWPKGFVMDWTEDEVEKQAPNINNYKYEKIDKFLKEYYDPKKKKFDDNFIDTRHNADFYEYLEYNSKDYVIEGFENKSSGGDSSFQLGGAAAREKIIEEAERISKLCANGKAGYSQPNRYAHGNNSINGIHYYDCSSFAQHCYQYAGIVLNGATTYPQKDECQSSAGGIIFPVSEIKSKGKKGDLLFNASVGHVGIYDGNGGFYAAHGRDGKPLNKQLGHRDNLGTFVVCGRPKSLVEADKKADSNFLGLKIPKNISNKDFIKLITPPAVALMHKYKIWASFIVVNAIIESSWGTSNLAVGGNNLFGVKAYGWKGKTYGRAPASEDSMPYRAYNSIYDSMEDHCKVLMGSLYKEIREARGPIEAGYMLCHHYCGDQSRGRSNEQTIRANNLLALDKL